MSSYVDLELELIAEARTMVARASAAGDGRGGDGGQSYPSAEAKNYAQAALALTQAACTVGKARAEQRRQR